MKYVLDTNVVVRAFDGDDRVLARLGAVESSAVGIPLLVVGELLYGAEKSLRREVNLARVEQLTREFRLLHLGLAIIRRYAVVRADLDRRGRRKSDFDLIIASTALEHDATLVTNDAALKDGEIEGLVVQDWLTDIE